MMLFAQDSLKLHVKIPAGKPQIIPIPTTSGGRSVIQTKDGMRTIKLEPPKIFTLPLVKTFISPNKPVLFPDQTEAGQGMFQTYTTLNGLPVDVIAASCVDHFGNLWFGTNGGGVSRYDGKSFVNYTTTQGLSNNVVWSILEDKSGNLWFATYGGGVSRYNGKSFTNYTTAQGLAGNIVMSILEDKSGNLWFGTSTGLSKYIQNSKDGSASQFVNYTTAEGLVNNEVLSMGEDKNGNLWIGTSGGVSRYEIPKKGRFPRFVNYTSAQGLVNNNVRCIYEDKRGNLWLGTSDGLSRYKENLNKADSSQFFNYTMEQGLVNNIVRCILEDKKGNIWFGTSGGVSCYHAYSKNGEPDCFVNYTTKQGLSNNEVWSISEDKNGDLWLGTFGGGISRFSGKSCFTYNTSQGLASNIVWSIMEDKAKNIWFGTSNGVSRYNGKTFVNYNSSQGLVADVVKCIHEDKSGTIWFGTFGGGVSRFEEHPKDGSAARFVNYTTAQGLGSNTVWSILEDKTGNILFCTSSGVSRFIENPVDGTGSYFVNYNTKIGFENVTVWSSLEDKNGKLWFGTNGGGISKLIEDRKDQNATRFINYNTSQGLANNDVFSLLEDKTGRLWFGTGQGLSYLDETILPSKNKIKKKGTEKNKQGEKIFKTITTANGLPDDFVTQLLELPNGKIAVGTNLGIAFFYATNFDGHKLQELEVYNSSTGYPINDVNAGQNALGKTSKGIIWIANGAKGAARFDYSEIHHNPNPLRVIIQSIKINEKNICWYSLDSKLKIKNSDTTPNSKNDFAKNDGNDSLIINQQEIISYGKILSTEVRDSIRKKFSGIQFDKIEPFYPLPTNLVLPFENNQIAFEFVAVEPSRPNLVKYQYILEGYDKEWSPITNKTNVSFGNIREGTYTFKLKAQSPEGVWSESVSYKFKVLPPWWRTWWMYSIDLIAISIILYMLYRWRTASLRKNKKILEDTVVKRTQQLYEQKQIVEEKQNEILESIHYASRIQQALMPDMNELKQRFPEIFVFNKPKDIVSGDFYWFKQLGDYSLLACVDCTGHGVPGAFMSTLGTLLLDKVIITGLKDPSKILNQLSIEINQTLHQNIDKGIQDGMDLSLCLIDHQQKKINFCGARNGIILVSNGKAKRFKADLFPVGGSYTKKGVEVNRIFKNQEIDLKEGDWIYMYTDGFIEQMGERMSGAPMNYKQFESYLIEVSTNDSTEIKELCLQKRLEEWRGALARTDDVLIIGFQI